MKLILAKIIYWLGLGLLIAGFIACVSIMIWGLVSIIPQEQWFILGIFVAGFIVVLSFSAVFGWAEDYINNSDKLDNKRK